MKAQLAEHSGQEPNLRTGKSHFFTLLQSLDETDAFPVAIRSSHR